MNSFDHFNEKQAEYVIVGAGISGLLLALKLSKDPIKLGKGIIVLEKEAQLGGRFFFTQLNQFTGKNNTQVLDEIHENSIKNLFLSGPGFEFLDANSLEVLYRHFEAQLTEAEKNKLDEFYSELNKISSNEQQERKIVFVKKEYVELNELLLSSSDFFTKKEAEYLKNLLNDSLQNSENKNNENILFEKSKYWLDLPKSTKDTLTPFFQTIFGPNWEKARLSVLQKGLSDFFINFRKKIPSYFYRNACFEYFIANVLRSRGVVIRNLCELVRVQTNADKKFKLMLSDELQPEHKQLECNRLIFAMPLNDCLGIIAKEHFSPNQSRFLSKVRPLSLVISEITNFNELKNEQWPAYLQTGDCLVFPVERTIAYITSDNRILMTIKLDYEESLQAPAVREAISRLRKALTRIIKQELTEELKKGARIPQKRIAERIILLPVAITIPCDIAANVEVKETKMGIEGMYCCGDNFPGMADESWKMVVNSVNDVCQNLS